MLLPGGPHIIIKTRLPVLGRCAAMPECDIGGQCQCGHTVEKNTLTSRRGGCSLPLLTQPTSGHVMSADCFNNMTGSSSGWNFYSRAVSGAIGETSKLLIFDDGEAGGGDLTHKRTVALAIYLKFGFATPSSKHLASSTPFCSSVRR